MSIHGNILEQVFPNSAKQFRILKFMIENDTWLTLYALSKNAGIKVRREYLERLARLGIVHRNELGYYRINKEHWFVKALVSFFKNVGYMD
ncbi:MAG: hypothetical protein DRJ38_09230 [Thermoprotei archaeon]|nr:MAG: hypothetical protein DRJ38_09230 [Thermoprotei archaeon]